MSAPTGLVSVPTGGGKTVETQIPEQVIEVNPGLEHIQRTRAKLFKDTNSQRRKDELPDLSRGANEPVQPTFVNT